MSTPYFDLRVIQQFFAAIVLLCLLFGRYLRRENPRFRCKNAKERIELGPYPRTAPAQTRKTVHEHESTAKFSVTPLFAGVAWREAVETAVCANESASVLCTVYRSEDTYLHVRGHHYG